MVPSYVIFLIPRPWNRTHSVPLHLRPPASSLKPSPEIHNRSSAPQGWSAVGKGTTNPTASLKITSTVCQFFPHFIYAIFGKNENKFAGYAMVLNKFISFLLQACLCPGFLFSMWYCGFVRDFKWEGSTIGPLDLFYFLIIFNVIQIEDLLRWLATNWSSGAWAVQKPELERL